MRSKRDATRTRRPRRTQPDASQARAGDAAPAAPEAFNTFPGLTAEEFTVAVLEILAARAEEARAERTRAVEITRIAALIEHLNVPIDVAGAIERGLTIGQFWSEVLLRAPTLGFRH